MTYLNTQFAPQTQMYGAGYSFGAGAMNGSSMFGMANAFGYGNFGYGGYGSGYHGMSAGGATGAFLGGQFQFSRTPVFQQVAHHNFFLNAWTEEQKQVTNEKGKMWDVWFDHKAGQDTKQLSPIVLDLNGDGKAGITGQNIKGDGKITGNPVMFDLDPSQSSWSHKSKMRRPGRGAPAVDGGHWKNGKYLDKNGKVVGEMRDGLYHWGNHEPREKTEWLKKNGGDGLLVWDVNGDGQIGSSKELFGNFDIHGKKKFENGYEKLAHYFDKNGDGKVRGKELKGLQIWADQNANGKVDKGELQSLKQHDINMLNTSFNEKDMSSSYNMRHVDTKEVQRYEMGMYSTLQNVFAGWQNNFSMSMFGGMYGGGYGYGW